MKIITIPVLAAALATTSVAPQAVFAAPLSIVSEVSSMDKVIEGLIAEIRTSSTKPIAMARGLRKLALPFWSC
jgi:hypothetical protein